MAHMINKPIAWNHAVHGASEFYTHKQWSVVKSANGTWDVLVNGTTLSTGDPDASSALRRADVLIRNPVEL